MLVILELDAAGKPLCAASITDDRGEPVRVDDCREGCENVCFEIRQGRTVFTVQTSACPGVILARALAEWAGGKCEQKAVEEE